MDGQPGPSRAPASAGSAAEPAGAISSSSSSASGASAGGARPGAFSTNTAAARPAGAPAAEQSSVGQGKQPAQATATGEGPGTPTGGPRGASSSAAGAAAQRTAPDPRPQGQQSGTVNPGTGPVSVGGPAGLVRRQVLNSILVNTRQVRPFSRGVGTQILSCTLTPSSCRRNRKETRSSGTSGRCRGNTATSSATTRSARPPASYTSRESERSIGLLRAESSATDDMPARCTQNPLPPPPPRIHPPTHLRPRRQLQSPHHPRAM